MNGLVKVDEVPSETEAAMWVYIQNFAGVLEKHISGMFWNLKNGSCARISSVRWRDIITRRVPRLLLQGGTWSDRTKNMKCTVTQCFLLKLLGEGLERLIHRTVEVEEASPTTEPAMCLYRQISWLVCSPLRALFGWWYFGALENTVLNVVRTRFFSQSCLGFHGER